MVFEEALRRQNPWWIDSKEIGSDFKVSFALNQKHKVLYSFDVETHRIFFGPRQVGKTTFLKLLIYDLIKNKSIDPRNIFYFSCEPLNTKNDLIALFEEIDSFAIGGKKFLFLDEVSMISDWELAVKYFLDSTLARNKILYLTGSSAIFLKKGFERLPGRNIEFELFLPLSFREFLLHFSSSKLKGQLIRAKISLSDLAKLDNIKKNCQKLLPFVSELNTFFQTYLSTGGFLKPIYEFFEKKEISEETFNAYINWVLGDLSRFDKNEHFFKQIISSVIKNYSSKYSSNSVANQTNIGSHKTVNSYLDFMQSLILVNNLYQVDISKKKPIFRKEKKTYFVDSFLFSIFMNYSQGFIEKQDSKIVEGILCEAFTRLNRVNLENSHFLWFFVGKKETDFVLKVGQELVGIELKYQETVSERDFNNARTFKKHFILSKKAFDSNQNIFPVSVFLALLEK